MYRNIFINIVHCHRLGKKWARDRTRMNGRERERASAKYSKKSNSTLSRSSPRKINAKKILIYTHTHRERYTIVEWTKFIGWTAKKGAKNKIQMKQKKIHIYHKNCQRNINLWLTEEKSSKCQNEWWICVRGSTVNTTLHTNALLFLQMTAVAPPLPLLLLPATANNNSNNDLMI